MTRYGVKDNPLETVLVILAFSLVLIGQAGWAWFDYRRLAQKTPWEAEVVSSSPAVTRSGTVVGTRVSFRSVDTPQRKVDIRLDDSSPIAVGEHVRMFHVSHLFDPDEELPEQWLTRARPGVWTHALAALGVVGLLGIEIARRRAGIRWSSSS